MNNTLAIIRSLIIYGLCLPLAIFLGYLLANPLDRVGLTVVVVASLLPLIPALLRWHHLLLIVSWNMSMVLFFIQGSPYLWMAMTALSLSLSILQHILKRNVEFCHVPSIIKPLLFLGLVILITAKLTGGIGLRSFGGEAYGGKRYIQLFCAIAGYFAITSHRIPPARANFYVALYFLSGLTMIIGSLAPWIPRDLHILFALFPVDSTQLLTGQVNMEYLRLGGLTTGAVGAMCFLLSQHGLGGLFGLREAWRFLPFQFKGGFQINQPWRILTFLLIGVVIMAGGYRSLTITLIIIFALLFHFERLIRTPLAPTLLLLTVLTAAVTLPFVDKLPLTIQRSLSFLPIDVNPLARVDAESSIEWRVKMWQEVVPSIPQYLLIGKGYSIDPRELENAFELGGVGDTATSAGATVASDFHNGPLSLLIPLGIFGVIGFLWFLFAAFRVLLNNYRNGLPEHRRLNTFLLVYFLTKVFLFFVIFGSFQNDLALYTGLVGLSVSINGGVRRSVLASQPQPGLLPLRLPKAARA